MKNVAKCDTWCELQNPVNHRVFERKLRLKPLVWRSVLSGGPDPSPLERGAGEGESPIVPGPCRTTDALLVLIGRVVASGAVPLKKLECSKQAYALDTLARDNIIGFRSYYVGLRDRSND
ncbi:hypothetical protein TEA_026626 [Camellia sinensis var. sinensis]|uniref:Uncharacterized protein n=1 Tax=Camellia sinensis var. sinensis TaxID=542762 RepID=A0A4S4EWG6_CAMSN|nr:hypothetical protein TEA_026626 [Camellia sinensis var. sinensis]